MYKQNAVRFSRLVLFLLLWFLPFFCFVLGCLWLGFLSSQLNKCIFSCFINNLCESHGEATFCNLPGTNLNKKLKLKVKPVSGADFTSAAGRESDTVQLHNHLTLISAVLCWRAFTRISDARVGPALYLIKGGTR